MFVEQSKKFIDKWGVSIVTLAGAFGVVAVSASSIAENIGDLSSEYTSTLMNSAIEERLSSIRIYKIRQDRNVAPNTEQEYTDMNCCPNDIPIGYSFDTPRRGYIHPRVRYVEMNGKNGYNLAIFNDAAKEFGVATITAYAVCLHIKATKCSAGAPVIRDDSKETK